MEKGIHILGLGTLGKYIAYALRQSHQADVLSSSPPVTLLFHRRYFVKHWESENRSVSYTTKPYNPSPDAKPFEPATGFHVELTSDAAARIQPGEIENHPDFIVNSDAPIKHLVVATRTIATISAITPIKHRLNKDSHILFLQNGMGVTDQVSERLFPDPEGRPTYWAGICSAGVYAPSAFSIVRARSGPLSIGLIGDASSASNFSLPAMERNPMVARLLGAPLLETRLLSPEQILRARLLKLVVNSVFNPLTAIFGCKSGDLIDSAEARDMSLHLIREAGLIARAMLPRSSDDHVEQEFTDEALSDLFWDLARKNANNIGSMLQDIRKGRKTEVDYINGYLVSQGQRLGLPTVHHEKICDTIRKLESEHMDQRSREI